MPRIRMVIAMRYAVRILIGLGSITLAGYAAAQVGLWSDRGGVGLRPSASAPQATQTEPYAETQASSPDFSLYRGERDVQRSGSVSSENYSGFAYSFSRRWGSSIEAGVVPESVTAPRRYSLSGELGATLAKDRVLSLGLKLRHYDSTSEAAPYSALRGGIGAGHSLAPSAFDSSYEVRLSYRYGESSSFGLALGRDLETRTPGLDAPANGDRQFMFTGQHALTPNWGLTYDLLSDEPGLRVQGVRLGLRYRF